MIRPSSASLQTKTPLLTYLKNGGIVHYRDFTISLDPNDPAYIILYQNALKHLFACNTAGLEAALEQAQPAF